MSESVQTIAPQKPGKLLPVLLVFNMLLVGAVLAVLLLRPAQGGAATHAGKGAAEASGHGAPAAAEGQDAHGGGDKAAAAAAAAAQMGPTVRLPDFVIHLRDADAERYARLSFEVEVATEKDKTDLTTRLALVRDVFIAYLSDRTVEELRGSEGLQITKAALQKKLVAAAPAVTIRGLYVTDLVMQ